MPEFTQYPNESGTDFAKRMQKKTKSGGLVKAANRFLQTSTDKNKKKGINRDY